MCLRLVCCLLLLTAAGCRTRGSSLVPEPGEPPPLRLDFRPPVARALTEQVTRVLTVARGGVAGPELRAEMTAVSRFTPAEGGWLLTQEVPRAQLLRAGAPVETGVDDVLTRLSLKVRLAADGAFVALVDPEAGLRALREGAPEAGPALERFFSPEALEARTRREWEEAYGGLFQRNLPLGHRTHAVGSFLAGEREVVFLLERTVTGTEPTAHGDAVTLALRCLDAVGEGAPQAVREAWAAAGAPALTPGVTCEGTQRIARSRFLPVHRALSVRAPLGDETWVLRWESTLESLEEEAQ